MVIAAPEQLPTPPRMWGWQIQLYAARSSQSWGIGDFRDLALICRTAHTQGARCVQVSPVHALAPISRPQDSPYSPASRNFLNLLHIAPGWAPGAERVDLSDLAAAGRALNEQRLIDRAAVWQLKRTALERIWAQVRDDLPIEYRTWNRAMGRPLYRFALWSAIVERFDSPDWQSWPEGLRKPDSADIQEFAAQNQERIEFFSWCQWVADLQYGVACNSGVDVLADLAVGFDINSEEAWAFQDLLDFGFEIGAPPDHNNPEGQHWGLPPFNPMLLAQEDFRPFINMVHNALRHAGALRIDHVMQLWRLYWVPKGGPATEGVYVYSSVDALLAILRVEAHRNHAWIVGEDMGTVAEGVRETMAGIGMLGNRSAVRTAIADFPELAVGTAATHDQATLAGLVTGWDEQELRRIGKRADFELIGRLRREFAEMSRIDPDKSSSEITDDDVHSAVLARYSMLADAPSRVVVVSLDDAAMVRERPNIPGIVGAYPNWCYALPQPVDQVMDSALAKELVSLLSEHR
jgi:4-alpha-glucanotransferase